MRCLIYARSSNLLAIFCKGFIMEFIPYLNQNIYDNHSNLSSQYKSRLSSSLPEYRRTYGAMVAALDEMIGRVVLGLEEANLLHNTVVIFSSDNGGGAAGYGLSFASNWPLRGVKSEEKH